MVSSPYRDGCQAQFIDIPAKFPQERGINEITEFLNANLGNDYTLCELSERFSMSRRTLIRHFTQATGMSVKKWVTSMRLKRSCELLESTQWSIERIAMESGFGSAALFRHHFIRQYHIRHSSGARDFSTADGMKMTETLYNTYSSYQVTGIFNKFFADLII